MFQVIPALQLCGRWIAKLQVPKARTGAVHIGQHETESVGQTWQQHLDLFDLFTWANIQISCTKDCHQWHLVPPEYPEFEISVGIQPSGERKNGAACHCELLVDAGLCANFRVPGVALQHHSFTSLCREPDFVGFTGCVRPEFCGRKLASAVWADGMIMCYP